MIDSNNPGADGSVGQAVREILSGLSEETVLVMQVTELVGGPVSQLHPWFEMAKRLYNDEGRLHEWARPIVLNYFTDQPIDY